MTVTVTSPFGGATNPFTWIGGLGWDPRMANNVITGGQMDPFHEIASSLAGAGQGICVNPTFAQSNWAGGFIYWEIGWADVDPLLLGGIGVCVSPPVGNPPGAMFVLGTFYNNLATDGTGGIILRPNGDIWAGGQMLAPGSATGMAQIAGDTVGIMLDYTNPSAVGVLFFGAGGMGIIHTADYFIPSGTAYVPCIVFDNAPAASINVSTANFGRRGPGSFLGPPLYPGSFDGVTLGWPLSP